MRCQIRRIDPESLFERVNGPKGLSLHCIEQQRRIVASEKHCTCYRLGTTGSSLLNHSTSVLLVPLFIVLTLLCKVIHQFCAVHPQLSPCRVSISPRGRRWTVTVSISLKTCNTKDLSHIYCLRLFCTHTEGCVIVRWLSQLQW